MAGLEDFGRRPVQQAGAEGTPAFPVLDLGVDRIGHPGTAGVAENTAVAQGPGAELHAALEPGQGMALGQDFGPPDRHPARVEPFPDGL